MGWRGIINAIRKVQTMQIWKQRQEKRKLAFGGIKIRLLPGTGENQNAIKCKIYENLGFNDCVFYLTLCKSITKKQY